jgi:electron transfer flavoprotein alpha subunit
MAGHAPAKTEQLPDFSDYRGVWVHIHQRDGVAAPVGWQLLGRAREMAEVLGCATGAVVVGHQVRHLADQAIHYGADVVYVVDAPVLALYRTQPWALAVSQVVQQYKPEIMLFGSTNDGRDLAGAVATILQTGLTADSTELSVDPETRILHASRPDFGGKLMSTILCKQHRPQMVTCRPGVFPAPQPDPTRQGRIVEVPFELDESEIPTKVLAFLPEEKKVDLSTAKVIVAGGRGMGGPEGFAMLRDVAEALGAALGASRVAVNAGWISYEHQVGQTGQTVRPKLYIACGISGQIQHQVGMQDADIIVAINRDPNAPIFKLATYGIVGDIFEIGPAIARRARELRARFAQQQPAAEGAREPAAASPSGSSTA